MEKNIQAIKNYMEFLNQNYNLTITIYAKSYALANVVSMIPSYNIHTNKYCLYVKSHPEMWDKCIQNKMKLFTYIQENNCESFFGSCYAGVGEFIMPINSGEHLHGFISIGSYYASASKMQHCCNKYTFNNKALMHEYFETQLRRDIPDKNFIEMIIRPLCSMLLLESANKPSEWYSGSEKIANTALLYIQRNYESKINLANTAANCHCSARILSKVFKQKTGFSVCNYIEKLRMEKSQMLLENTKLPITEIAFLCGYSDSNYFSGRFSKYFGMCPSEVRKHILLG